MHRGVHATRPRQRSKVANVAAKRIAAILLWASVQKIVAGQYSAGSGEIPESVTPQTAQNVPKNGLPINRKRRQELGLETGTTRIIHPIEKTT